jgi:hypothetical protein
MDFSNSKTNGTSVYPVHAQGASSLLRRCEPFLTPDMLLKRYLKGVPLKFPNGDEITSEDLKDRINIAMNDVELLIGTTITRTAFKDKLAFDWSLYKSFIHLKTEQGPIASLEALTITASNGVVIFQIPPEWIETANFSKNLINVIPLLAAFGATSVQGTPIATNSGAGAAFLAIWSASGNAGQIPAYWEVKYTSGVSNKEGQVPVVVNSLIGVLAAIEILSEVASSNIFNSQSMSQDGISQSSSGPGPNVYSKRIDDLEKKKEELVRKLKAVFSRRYFISNI